MPLEAASKCMGDGGACALGRGVRLTMLEAKEEEQRSVKREEQLLGRGVRLTVLETKEEEQRSVKKEEQLLGGRVVLMAAPAAAAFAVRQEGIARSRAPPLVIIDQVLATGAFGLERVLVWVMPARDVRPGSVELGDVFAEEECLELTL